MASSARAVIEGRVRRYPRASAATAIALAMVLVTSLSSLLKRGKDLSQYAPNLSTPREGLYEEMVLVFIGASFCGAAQSPGFPEAIEKLKIDVAEEAAHQKMLFRVVGVALDWQVNKGLEFLDAFGAFNEVSSGSNWTNAEAIRYVWRDLPGAPGVPQVLLLQRVVEYGKTGLRVGPDSLIDRRVGIEEISAWIKRRNRA